MTSLRNDLQEWVGHAFLSQAIVLAVCFIVALLLSFLLSRFVVYAVTRWLTPFDTEEDNQFDALFRQLEAPLRLLVFGLLLQFSSPSLFEEKWSAPVAHSALILSVAAGGWAVLRAIRILEHTAMVRFDLRTNGDVESRALMTQLRGFRNIATFLTIVVTVAFVLLTFERVRELGAGLLASAGVAGVVLGFAAQKSIATIVAGIQIALTQPIRVDDVVIVEGEWGRIEEITLTYVVVRIWDLRRLVVPINYFIEKPFQNWTRTSAELLGTVELHVDYTVPIDAIREETQRILEASQYWDGKVCNVQVTNSSAQAMVLRPLFSAKDSSDQWNLRCEVREKLIAFVQDRFPGSLPRLRAEMHQPKAPYGPNPAEPPAPAPRA